ncbi:MAG: hypothetical protein ACI9XO_000519 [Paraglaciecola sp.]|jgi:hypothetical protein
MKSSSFLFFKIALLFLLINAGNLLAQEVDQPTHVLYEKNKGSITGKLISMNGNAIVFADSSGAQKVFHQVEIDSVVQVVFVENVGGIKTEKAAVKTLTAIEQTLKAYPSIEIDENLKIGNLTQEHSLTTTWGQKYAGILISMTPEKVVLITQKGMDLPFKIKEIRRIQVIPSDGTVKKRYKNIPSTRLGAKAKRVIINKVRAQRKQTHIPYRIGIVPTAFNLPKGQLLLRASAGYLAEFVVAEQYFQFSAGFSGWFTQFRLKVGVPIKKYLHIGLVVEATGDQLVSSGNFKYAIAPIVTLGTPDYFLNLAYKSNSPMFIPINDRFDNSIISPANYWSFGAGVRVTDNFQFVTESLLIESDNLQRHYRVFLGFTLRRKNQTFGAGASFWDTEDLEDDPFFNRNFSGVIPSLQYTVRFR